MQLFLFLKSFRGELTHSVCSRTRSGLRFSCVQTGPGLWQRKLDPDRRETPAVLRGRAPILRCPCCTALQHPGATVGTEHKTTLIHWTTVQLFYAFHVRLFSDSSFYLWVCAVELRIYLFKRVDWRQIQSFSDCSVTTEAKVSSSLDRHGHQICPGEP